jgi:hypothetical protein
MDEAPTPEPVPELLSGRWSWVRPVLMIVLVAIAAGLFVGIHFWLGVLVLVVALIIAPRGWVNIGGSGGIRAEPIGWPSEHEPPPPSDDDDADEPPRA